MVRSFSESTAEALFILALHCWYELGMVVPQLVVAHRLCYTIVVWPASVDHQHLSASIMLVTVSLTGCIQALAVRVQK